MLGLLNINEFVGRVNSKTDAVSIARMRSPGGWKEPGQIGQFDEYTVVLKGTLHLRTHDGEMDVNKGQAVIVSAGEWVQYSTPSSQGAEYVAVMSAGILTRHGAERRIAGPAREISGQLLLLLNLLGHLLTGSF